MTLLIAVEDATRDRELVTAAQGLAAAAHWRAGVVHVLEEPAARGLGVSELDGLEVAQISGAPAPTIRLLADEAGVDAVAIGLRTDARQGIGHVALALLGRIRAPLLLVRPGMRPLTSLRRLLVPLEGSPSASEAMHYVDDLLCARGREIVLLHVVTSDTPGEAGSMPAPRLVDQEQYEWEEWKEEFTMRFAQCPQGGRHRVAVRVGEPAEAIVEEADQDDAELIVLSWSGSLAEGRATVVRALFERAPCPLLVVSSPPAA